MLLHRFYISRIFSAILWSSGALINLVDTFLPTLSTLSEITHLRPSPPLCGGAAAAEKVAVVLKLCFHSTPQLHNSELQIVSDGRSVKVGGSR